MRRLARQWIGLSAWLDWQCIRAWVRAAVFLAPAMAAGELVCGAQATLVADAHVNSALPTVNSGGISNLNVGGGYTALLQFDLSLLPAGATAAQVQRAVLRVYCNRVTTAGTVSLMPVTGPWGESSVTFATMPGVGTPVASLAVTQAGQFVAADVTALVQGWVSAPATNNGVALAAAAAAVQFDSKENDESSHPATLEVVLVDAGPAGIAGATGATGPAGAVGPIGATGATGAAGAVGPAGIAGPTGLPGPMGAMGATGPMGAAGPTGATGAQGLQGSTGSIGPAGPAGPQGAMGTVGPTGSTGATGPGGAAASVTVGTVTTGAAGTQAAVTNTGTSGAAVLNFTIPQGAAGTGGSGGGGGGGTSGIPFTSTYHGGSLGDLYYSVNTSTSSATESVPLLTWVPAGCTATELAVFSQQMNPITVTLRVGAAGNLANTSLACSAAAGSSCTATGSVAVATGDFVDLGVSGANGTGAVWTALACN